MNENQIKDIARQLGHRGGKATSDKYGTEHYKRISKLAVEAKRKKKAL